jgi:glycosyltransferase involved in cell wall biosynthesis
MTAATQRVFEASPLAASAGVEPYRQWRPRRVALIGNFLPRLCRIATFTTHVHDSLRHRFPASAVDVYAMVDPGQAYDYPEPVVATIDQERLADYFTAARAIEASGADLVWLQHEFGIFGGPAGRLVLALLDRISAPVMVTLHTVLEHPSPAQYEVLTGLITRCAKLIVMADTGCEILERVYKVPRSKIAVIPHGVPDWPFVDPDTLKRCFGFHGRQVILTFGLLSPGKGIETVINALPRIVAQCPEALYVVLGATHPHLVAREGEGYRRHLQALAKERGVARYLHWVDGFVSERESLDYLAAADVYVTPYLNPAQITSGTLSYAIGLGKPVVSTPYIHATELLAGDHGVLVDFADSPGMSHAIGALLSNEAARAALASKAYRLGRNMVWNKTIDAAVALFAEHPVSFLNNRGLDGHSSHDSKIDNLATP